MPRSLRARLGRLLLALALAWFALVGAVLWAVLRHEVDELLDDGLHATAQSLHQVFGRAGGNLAAVQAGDAAGAAEDLPFVWQVVEAPARVVSRSPHAPVRPLTAVPATGLVDADHEWRVHAGALGDGRWLLVGQRRSERFEAMVEVAGGTIAAALLVGLGGIAALRWRLRRELEPLADLRRVMAGYDPLVPGAALPPPVLSELAPVHEAVQALGTRLARHAVTERAFTAHAAHALRTPLAGIDAQLAVAAREAPEALRPRLERTRAATARLAQVVGALLALFRSGGELRLQRVDVAALLARLPVEGLTLNVHGRVVDGADADLLAAALINLLDNALRHGARGVDVQVEPQRIVLRDDGPGAEPARLEQLRRALDREALPADDDGAGADDEGALTGLGLALADRVARAHGGRLELLPAGAGFAVALHLAPQPPANAAA